VVNIKLRPLYPWKRTPVLTELEAGWAPEPFWAFYRREISTVLPGIRTLNPKILITDVLRIQKKHQTGGSNRQLLLSLLTRKNEKIRTVII
jgi:hypothetical protein